MGDRYILTVVCSNCKYIDNDVFYAPTCGFIDWKCPKCGTIKDLELYTGISAVGCASTSSGVDFVNKQKNSSK